MKNKIIENVKTLIFAIVIAMIIRIFFFQPFYIPSSSMEPNLLVGDRLFVTKYSYGYSRHSFPFSPKFSNKRYLYYEEPKRGEVIVFKTPQDNRTDYVKRLIGLPGDKIQFINSDLYINGNKVKKNKIIYDNNKIYCGDNKIEIDAFTEQLPNGKEYIAVYRKSGTMQNSDIFKVPENHFFFLGDNRDCSKDSRYLSSVGYVNAENLVGKAQIIFFSNDKKKGIFLKIWKWHDSIRLNRFFKKIL